MHAVRKNRYVILPKDFDKGYRSNVKKPDTDFEFYKWSLEGIETKLMQSQQPLLSLTVLCIPRVSTFNWVGVSDLSFMDPSCRLVLSICWNVGLLNSPSCLHGVDQLSYVLIMQTWSPNRIFKSLSWISSSPPLMSWLCFMFYPIWDIFVLEVPFAMFWTLVWKSHL